MNLTMVMKLMIVLFLLTIFLIPTNLRAEQKYNPYTGEYETVYPGAELKYNPYTGIMSTPDQTHPHNIIPTQRISRWHRKGHLRCTIHSVVNGNSQNNQ
jgi:hypothetical protein